VRDPSCAYMVGSRDSGSNPRFVAFGQRAVHSRSVLIVSGLTVRDILVCRRYFVSTRTSEMPTETSILYGEMAGSWALHLTMPLVAGFMMKAVPATAPRTIVLISMIVIMSFALQTGLIAFLQQAACNGVKNYTRIFVAGAIAAVITAAMVAIPAYVEPARLVVSQLFTTHKSQLTPELERAERIVERAAAELASVPVPVQQGGAMTSDEFQQQTERETSIGMAYWAAFAGAYGIGVGSMIASRCS
jgi:hypothetical protein